MRPGDAELLSANHLTGRIKAVKSGHEVPEYWKRVILYNGEIECCFFEYELYAGSMKHVAPSEPAPAEI